MTEKLKDYQVLDVLCSGTLYKVKHKVTNFVYTWKAYDYSQYSDDQIQDIVCDVKSINKVVSENLLQYYDTIFHTPSKTLYFVLEFNSWQSVQELIEYCLSTDRYIAENYVWYVLLELARVCKAIESIKLRILQKCIKTTSIFLAESGELRVNCFELVSDVKDVSGIMRQVGDVLHTVCYMSDASKNKIKEFCYSDDLQDVIGLLTNDRNGNLRPDVVLYHPTVLANMETTKTPKYLCELLIPLKSKISKSDLNKCDSEKAVEIRSTIEPAPRTHLRIPDSPIYCNISPNKNIMLEIERSNENRGSLSPTLAALALELPGYVPRSRKPYSEAMVPNNYPQQISEETLSNQWMSRLIALRQREESLNKRERDIISKEIMNSPAVKMIPLKNSEHVLNDSESNGITLPSVITQVEEKPCWVSRRRHNRTSSVRTRSRRKSQNYVDLDSSLSADPGDESMIITATKFTKDNMPRRNIFPNISSKKVHFTSSNPFAESDESVTLTFYDLENVDKEGYQVPRQNDITKFKYLDIEKVTAEKRAAMKQWSSSPSKQAKTHILNDITNSGVIKKTPSKSSIMSKESNSSRCSIMSNKSQFSVNSIENKICEKADTKPFRKTRQSLAFTPSHTMEIKKTKSRKSLIPFKTPFKFMSKN